MINYKIREEKDGGFLFNRILGKAEKISEEKLQSLKSSIEFEKNPEWQLIKSKDRANLPQGCLSAPSRIYFELTRECTLRCKSCFNESSEPLKNELSTKEIFAILKQLSEAGTFEIRFTGGEPTTRTDFFRIIKRAKELGFYISMGTNGIYSPKKLSKIIECGVDWFIISLEGREKTNDFIRGKGSFKKAVKSIKALSNAGKRIRISSVIGKHNKNDIGFLADFADSVNAESLNLIPLRPYGRSLIFLNGQMLSQKEFFEMILEINKLRKSHKTKFVTTIDLLNKDNISKQDLIVRKETTCAAGVEAGVISPIGDFYGCSYSPASDPESKDLEGRELFVAGNLRKRPLMEIWNDSSRWTVFRNLKETKNEKCHSCKHYKHECIGSCPIMSYSENKSVNGLDPYCFKDIMGDCASAGK